jgi:hypothetical protein
MEDIKLGSKLPTNMSRTFRKAANSLSDTLKKDPTVVEHAINQNWKMLYCTNSQHYYAVRIDGASTIQSGRSCIRKAYRIDHQTGQCTSESAFETDSGEEFFEFAVKEYSTPTAKVEAEMEVETLQQHQFSEDIVMNNGTPTVISIYYPGVPLTDLGGKTTHHISTLSFAQRADLIHQVAKQFFQFHHHPEGSKVIIDVKGANIIVHVGEGIEPKLYVIDFGSATNTKGASDKVKTGLSGMTDYAIAPEALELALKSRKGKIPITMNSGTVSSKSDVYALTAIIASLLGSSDPYENRHCHAVSQGYFDVGAISATFQHGFNLKGIFDRGTKLTFKLPNPDQNVGYFPVNKPVQTKDKILEEFGRTSRCYIRYKNHLIYKDGSTLKGHDRRIARLTQKLKEIPEAKQLSEDNLARLDSISGFERTEQGQGLQTFLEPKIRYFLKIMLESDPDNRPSSSNVYEFFKTVHQLCQVSEKQQCSSISSLPLEQHEQLRIVQLGLIKLELIHIGAWDEYIVPKLISSVSEQKSSVSAQKSRDDSSSIFLNLYKDKDYQIKYNLLSKYLDEFEKYSKEEIDKPPDWPKSFNFGTYTSDRLETFGVFSQSGTTMATASGTPIPALSLE